jgi:hypothetical protein
MLSPQVMAFSRDVFAGVVAIALFGFLAKASGIPKRIASFVRSKSHADPGVWACGCSGDKPGDYLCGRCVDHCECRFDELGA